MKSFISKIWFPAVLTGLAAIQSFGIDTGRFHSFLQQQDSLAHVTGTDSVLMADSVVSESVADTTVADSTSMSADTAAVRDTMLQSAAQDSLPAYDSTAVADSLQSADTAVTIHARDTITVPDSLRYTDSLKFKYYIALKDSITRAAVRDSLRTIGDSLELHRLDSLVFKDSTETAIRDSIAYVNSLSRKERKKYLAELETARKLVELDSILHVKDSIRAYKDSIIENTPRILNTYALPDSMQYKRMVMWNHDRYFNDMQLQEIDTTYNHYFTEYPFLRNDVNATYLGVIGSPTVTYDFFKREEAENAFFYTPYMMYNYTPETLPMYNTKTPYTELAYWGTLFANSEKEESDVRVMTTQNILPELNITLEYDRFGGNGMLQNEDTDNRTFVAAANYLGKRYFMNAGYIYHRIQKSENGGVVDNFWIRDTTVDAREIAVRLSDASNRIKKNTVFLDQSYRIPFDFLTKEAREKRRERKAEKAYRDSLMATGDSLAIQQYLQAEAEKAASEAQSGTDSIVNNVTTAFIGHCSEYSVFTKAYNDVISADDTEGRDLYGGNFFMNPTTSSDSLRVMKLDNRIFLRLQPWSSEGIVSKLDVGIGDKLLNYHDFNRIDYLTVSRPVVRNSLYLFAGAQGKLKKYMNWDAKGRYTFLGSELNDFSINANLSVNFYPFRRHRNSPLSLGVHFETSLREPDYYEQHLHTNHYWWDNDFGKISTTKAEATLDIPVWNLRAFFGYALLNNNIYYDNHGSIQQNEVPMSVMTASVMKNFRLWNFHFDHQALFQLSSNENVLPLPMLALNFRYYFQFNVVRNVMQMQVGANATYTTKWHAPAYSPALGLFHTQNEELYGNCPYIDVFVNIQWKRACIFIKAVNLGMGWPNKSADYFSAHHYIRPQQAFKVGIFWPFYVQPNRPSSSNSKQGGANELRSSQE